MDSLTNEPMVTDMRSQEICLNFVDRELRPCFERLLRVMKGKRRSFVTEALFALVSSVYKAITQKLESVGESKNFVLRKEIFRYASHLLFSSEVVPEFTALLVKMFELSYMRFDWWRKEQEGWKRTNAVAVFDKVVKIVHMLRDPNGINISGRVMNAALQLAMHSVIDKFVTQVCIQSTGGHIMEALYQHMLLLKQWASHIQLSKQVDVMYSDLNKYMKRKVVDCLTKMIYKLVIIDYPQSGDLIDDFRHCMQFNGNYGRTEIVNRLSDEIEHRLLHVGAITTEVLEGYAKAVECLRRLDPTCVIMQRVCSLIRNYVKQRPDTVRCIITYITGEKRDELGKQLTKKKAAIIDEEELEGGINDDLIVGTDEVAENWREWTADPQDAVVGKSRRFRQNADVFNMLVSVYGSKELFVKEYRQILAERLIKSWNREPQSEMRYIDLLKLRFSEGELQQCEVMLKDIRDSEKIDDFAQDSLPFPISARIISSFFWPTIESENFLLPKTMMDGLEAYAKLFEMKKASRTLKWMTGVGCVQMDVIIDGVSMPVSASPAHVAVLAVFLEKEKWTLDEVASYIGMDKRNVKKRLEWWQSSGVITFSAKNVGSDAGLWCLGSGQLKVDQPPPEFDAEEESSEDGGEEDTEAVDALEQYWNYTKGFMANREPLKAEKLQSMYRMFASPGRQGPSLETVVAFLQRKVKQNLLTYSNGLYKIVKNPSNVT